MGGKLPPHKFPKCVWSGHQMNDVLHSTLDEVCSLTTMQRGISPLRASLSVCNSQLFPWQHMGGCEGRPSLGWVYNVSILPTSPWGSYFFLPLITQSHSKMCTLCLLPFFDNCVVKEVRCQNIKTRSLYQYNSWDSLPIYCRFQEASAEAPARI